MNMFVWCLVWDHPALGSVLWGSNLQEGIYNKKSIMYSFGEVICRSANGLSALNLPKCNLLRVSAEPLSTEYKCTDL